LSAKSQNSQSDNRLHAGNTERTYNLTQEEQKSLLEISRQIDQNSLRDGNSKYIRLKDGEVKTILFSPNPDKNKYEEVTFPSKDPSKQNKPTKRVRFTVKEAGENGVVESNAQEKEWPASLTAASDVISWMQRGFMLLDIERHGSELNTKYLIRPHF
jgi:hypothetical protein